MYVVFIAPKGSSLTSTWVLMYATVLASSEEAGASHTREKSVFGGTVLM